uniref:Putative cytochrome p450 cyp2 subfamily protein n=1 Tax=Amblyomma triste TaxID=251400 RepID=A0A023GPH0_AMBTT
MLLDVFQRFLSNFPAWELNWSAVAVWLSLVASGLLALKSLNWRRKDARLPPGPWGIPILGYFPFIWKPYHYAFKELADKYGPIFRLRMGCKDVVVLNDLASIREGLSDPNLLYRPDDFLFRYLNMKGIGGLNGEEWQANRRYGFQVMRNLGFAKKPMEVHMKEEVQCFNEFLERSKGRPITVFQELGSSIVNNISALVFGQRYDLGDTKGRFVEGMLTKFMLNATFFSVFDFMPIVRFLAYYTPHTRIYSVRSVFKDFKQLVREELKKRESNPAEYQNRDFIDGYSRKIQENNGGSSYFTLPCLLGIAINFYSASTNTVRSAILWNLYMAASDPDHQTRMQEEIDAVIGRERAPGWEDRARMPYTMASILEIMRWRTISPTGIHRAAKYDTTIGGYHIPAGTLILANFWKLHNDPTHWPDPSKYDPTRFLNADGTEVKEKSLAFLPFSLGKRSCPGETLAVMEIFIYVTTVLQKFRVLPEEGKIISLKPYDTLMTVADDTQKLCFTPR